MSRAPLIPRDQRSTVLPLLGVGVAIGAGLYYLGSLRHSVLEAVLLVLLAAVVLALVPWALTRTGAVAERAYWASTPRQESTPPSAMDYRLIRLRRDLRDAIERDDRTDAIQPLLREITAERLRSIHDIDLDAEPERAQAAVDPNLWRYLTTAPSGTRRRNRAMLHTAIEGIERL